MDRRTLITSGAAALAISATGVQAGIKRPKLFPRGFLWGVATSGHQIEGNNVNSDVWLLENTKPTLFSERSGDAANGFALWQQDLDLVASLGLNCYRFSLEWARIEPDKGEFSIAMLDHYKAIVDGCRSLNLMPVVTFNHFTAPRWFSAAGGWTSDRAPALFARFCDRAARHLGAGIGRATTLNEPNLPEILETTLPPQAAVLTNAMLEAVQRDAGAAKFRAFGAARQEDLPAIRRNQLAGHKAGRDAIKSVLPELPVGVSLAIMDDQAAGPGSKRDAMRARLYDEWLDAARGDDFLGVQNYERRVWDTTSIMPPPPGATLNFSGAEVYPASLANAVRYAYKAAGVPILVTEHGVGTDDDRVRASFIPAALEELHRAMAEGIPVLGYIHWSLLDNFEWVFGYRPRFGLVAFDRQTFKRMPKPSARVLGAIARRNSL